MEGRRGGGDGSLVLVDEALDSPKHQAGMGHGGGGGGGG